MEVQLTKIHNGIKKVLNIIKNKEIPSIPNEYFMLKKYNQSVSK